MPAKVAEAMKNIENHWTRIEHDWQNIGTPQEIIENPSNKYKTSVTWIDNYWENIEQVLNSFEQIVETIETTLKIIEQVLKFIETH